MLSCCCRLWKAAERQQDILAPFNRDNCNSKRGQEPTHSEHILNMYRRGTLLDIYIDKIFHEELAYWIFAFSGTDIRWYGWTLGYTGVMAMPLRMCSLGRLGYFMGHFSNQGVWESSPKKCKVWLNFAYLPTL